MFGTPFGDAIFARRDQKGLRQNALAAEIGIAAQRLSQIEHNERQPSLSEQAALQRSLGTIHAFVEPLGLSKSLRSNARRCFPDDKPYVPASDRPAHVRFATAKKRYPDLIHRLMRSICQRSDFDQCQALCNRLAFDSAEETIVPLLLLEAGALPCFSAPACSGRLPHTIVDPKRCQEVSHRLMPCLAFMGDFYFFQVTLRSAGWQHRVDVLRCRDGCWSVIETDGYGHDPEADAKRDRQIALPTLRLTVAQLTSANFDLQAALSKLSPAA